MNYYAHGREHVDDPYFLAGTAIPDWLSTIDRPVRVRSRHAAAFVEDADPRVAALARGIMRHHYDDAWFHQTTAFAELSWRFTVMVRDAGPSDDGLRPSFLGHILVELMLDSALAADEPGRLAAYYDALARVDARVVQAAVNRMAPRPTHRLAEFIPLFWREGFLWDYADDAKLWRRLNQVMRRVKLPELQASVAAILPEARRQVVETRRRLMTPEQ